MDQPPTRFRGFVTFCIWATIAVIFICLAYLLFQIWVAAIITAGAWFTAVFACLLWLKAADRRDQIERARYRRELERR